MGLMDILLGTLFLVICILLIIVVLLQKGRGGGLGAAFGGMGSSAFGTRVGDVFTWVTIVLTAMFLLLASVTTMLYRPAADQVAAPIFSPRPEQVPGDQPVTITMACSTGGAEIRFTLDESEPTKNSTLFESPITVRPNTVVKAIAFRGGGWTPSLVATAYYGPREEVTTQEAGPTLGLPGEGEGTAESLPAGAATAPAE